MDLNGVVQPQAPSSPADVLLAKRNAAQTAPQTGGDGGFFSQLSNNPFFTAVSEIAIA